MTMQRIDENTYIDDSLVTCAEYQLFIDEMHEHGKYFQPDHWTEYQFAKGQAKEPILGVRHADAAAFCEWLTHQDVGEWKFRLPSQEEANMFPVKPARSDPLGYWLFDAYQFVWIGSAPENAHPLDLVQVHGGARSTLISILSALARASKLDREFTRDIALNRAMLDAKEFADAVTSGFILGIDRNLAHANDFHTICVTTIDVARATSDALNRVIPNAQKLDPVTATRHTPNKNTDPKGYAIDIPSVITDASNYALDFCANILTLQERIAGSSRALEGIRLAKERVTQIKTKSVNE